MALVLADRVQETTTTTGTGSYSLAGATTGFQAFSSVLSTSDTTYYTATDGTDWEVGIGTFTSPSTLARTSILSSSNSNTAVNWAAGEKNVFITYPAGKAVYAGGPGTAFSTVSEIGTNTAAVTGTLYVLTASLTLTLPSSPSVGNFVGVVNLSNTLTAVVARNGEDIMNVAEDLTVDVLDANFTLTYSGATYGWVLS